MQGQHSPLQKLHLIHKRATKFHCKMDKYSCTTEKSLFRLGQSQSIPPLWGGWKELSMHWCLLMSLQCVCHTQQCPLGCAGNFRTSTVQYIHISVHPFPAQGHPKGPLLTPLWHCQESPTHTPCLLCKNPWISDISESAWKSLPEVTERAYTGVHKRDTGNQHLLSRSSGLQQNSCFGSFPLHCHS